MVLVLQHSIENFSINYEGDYCNALVFFMSLLIGCYTMENLQIKLKWLLFLDLNSKCFLIILSFFLFFFFCSDDDLIRSGDEDDDLFPSDDADGSEADDGLSFFEEEETKSRFTNYSMTSSVLRRNEGILGNQESNLNI